MLSVMDDLFETLAAVPERHDPTSQFCRMMRRAARAEVEWTFADREPKPIAFGPFGSIVFPFREMGKISSLNLFDIDELILFSFYWQNRDRYRRAADIGANIGLHSLILSRCGCAVRAYEPDPQHVAWLKETLASNGCTTAEVVPAAVSSASGSQEFIRVLDNTTGSHLAGAKANPYGRLERFIVETVAIRDIIRDVDFLKIDAEGHERQILTATKIDDWKTADAIVEIGSAENAAAVYEHFAGSPVRMFAQKSGWGQVQSPEEMPVSYREGSLFITQKDQMPWNNAETAPGSLRMNGRDPSQSGPTRAAA